ncbi:MAG: D-glycero-beta-D-manno-heptose 1-phosphate adenylyltransferase [Alphaproteobacteria bacterium]|nr:D-glycero-beta-D-manno-heptose 1-phosphate adenylyltransferase [Hyphomonas sp.]MBR9805774.1 D-glycero-beta-D-manno-heptose 1-phosphate adenylyltransferase [Alphaproteobacteria bacterium]|tara:strand:+ start:4177 stop:5637 length:1461 start_codon:yes stop_codon:yes gene_type:complete
MAGAPLTGLIRAASGKRVVCVGDVMLDRFVYGSVTRISPEAPVPIMRRAREAAMPGGAGNVARNLASLGMSASLLGVVGDDAEGRELAELLGNIEGIEADLIAMRGRSTTLKTRFVAGGQQLLRVDAEDTATIDSASEAELIASIADEAKNAAVIILSDYAKGAVTDGVIAAALKAGAENGVPVIADPKGRDFARYGAVDLLKPNASELAIALGLPVESDQEIEMALTAAQSVLPAKSVVVTRAAKGMSFAEEGEAPQHHSGQAREVYDVSGAGDTSIAALALGLAGGGSLSDAVSLAIAASGIAVGKAGTATVSAAELETALLLGLRNGGVSYLSLDAAKAQVEAWRDTGLTVGFTNGCFDILHPGHLRVLEEAKSRCGRLVVGLNSDASVSRLKGPSRPVNNADSRARVLSGLMAVDAVVVFEEDTPLDLIEALQPDLLVKGGDYSIDTIVGADIVQARGGSVHIVPLVDGQSTTAAIERAQAK